MYPFLLRVWTSAAVSEGREQRRFIRKHSGVKKMGLLSRCVVRKSTGSGYLEIGSGKEVRSKAREAIKEFEL